MTTDQINPTGGTTMSNDPFKKGSAMSPIMPTTAPAPSNSPMAQSSLDQAYEAMDQRYEASIRSTPLAQGETEAMRRSKLTESDSAYREAARRAISLTTAAKAGASGGTTADTQKVENLKKGAALIVDQAADAVIADAAKHGATVTKEQARTMVRKADPALAELEMGRS